jgi:Integrase core domain
VHPTNAELLAYMFGQPSTELLERNAYAERFVRTIKESCLDRLILFGEDSLRKPIQEFTVPYHLERNHQGLGNRLIMPDSGHCENTGEVRRRERLGGMLNYYYRDAA